MSNALCKTNKDIPQDMLLGNLVFMNIKDMQIPEAGLVSVFQSNNIPEMYVKKISKADAFRRATSSVKNKIIYLQDPSTGNMLKAKIEVDEVKSDIDGIKRIIGFKSVDEKNEDISYVPLGYVDFDRHKEVASYSIEHAYSYEADVVDTFTQCMTNYTNWSVYHTKDTIRNTINRIINDTHPISLMPTGICKFVPKSSADLMYNLKNALGEMSSYSINSGSENVMEIIPIINTDEQRDLIEKNFTSEVSDELFALSQEIKEVLQNKSVLSSRTAMSYIEKYKLLQAKAQEYENLLGVYTQAIHDQIVASLDLVNDNTDTED